MKMVQKQVPREYESADEGDNSDSDYKDDEPVVPAAPLLIRDDVQIAFDEIISQARSNKLNLGAKDKRVQFANTYGKVLAARTQAENQTLLHVVANTLGHKSLTRCLIRMHPALLEARDESNKTPLYIAITKKNLDFIAVVLKEAKGLDGLLSMPCEHGRNCLHAAVYHSLREPETIELINKASEATLCAQDQDGLTPLHIAVEYDRCSESQLRIVEALITKGDAALDVFTSRPRDLSVYQYHQYKRNRAMRQMADAAAAAWVADKGKEGPSSTEHDGAAPPDKRKREPDGPADRGDAPPLAQSKGEKVPPKPSYLATVNGDRAVTFAPSPVNGFSPVDWGRPPLVPTASEQHRHAPRKEGGGPNPQENGIPEGFKLERRPTAGPRQARKEDDSKRRPEDDRIRAEFADKIQDEIKLYYLRTTFRSWGHDKNRDQHSAIRFLHGENTENMNLCFDYTEGPTTILKDSFEQSYSYMKFDSVLRYVSFPKVELQRLPTPSKESKLAKRLAAQQPRPVLGRNDLQFLFDWLYQKGVRHILKVVVDDHENPPHSDQAIEESLRQFEVEILDWSREDLCPETIQMAARNVREVYLRWSGNRAVLRAWSEPEGLAKLEKLEKVHLTWDADKALESSERIRSYIDKFQARLDESLRTIQASRIAAKLGANPMALANPHLMLAALPTMNGSQPDIDMEEELKEGLRKNISVYSNEMGDARKEQLVRSGGLSKSSNSVSQQSALSNRWLTCMDAFADEIQNVRVPKTDQATLKDDITVALIDDGANAYIESLRGKIIGGDTFDTGYPDEDGPSPYYFSSKGHGTVMADMICRVCPMAKLFVYRLETHATADPSSGSQNQISARSAALAVEAAIVRRVDIISISWTVKKTKDNSAEIAELGDAVKKALDQGILLFCAAGDTGASSETDYPWAYDQRRIFRIGAATAEGMVWGAAGSLQNLTFILPGHRVVARNPHREGALPQDFEERTGSSVATALAAGLAALILNVVRMGAIQTELEGKAKIVSLTAVRAAEFDSIKEHDSMMAVLKAIGLDEGQQKFIEVWKRFDGPTNDLKTPSLEGPNQLGIVAKLARDLVSGISDTSR